MLEVTEFGIRLCAGTARGIGQTSFEILSFGSAKMMPELNYDYKQLSLNPTKGTIKNYSLATIYQFKSRIYLTLTT